MRRKFHVVDFATFSNLSARISTMLTLSWMFACICGYALSVSYAFQFKISKVSTRASHLHSSAATSDMSANFKLLVLGGTGFVGREVVKRARKKGFTVVSISRRGKLVDETDQSVTWVSGDASQPNTVQAVIDDFGPFDGCVHAVGLLLDTESGLSALNKYASGSGSSPTSESTYDRVTRQTGETICRFFNYFYHPLVNICRSFIIFLPLPIHAGFTAIDCLSTAGSTNTNNPIPFIFISAAEAGWTFKAPVDFLERYLIAKRAVEKKALTNKLLRSVILRPSLIWTLEKPAALISVIPFFIGNFIGLSFVDKPVLLSTLVDAALVSLLDKNINGILRFKEMEQLTAEGGNP